MRFKAFMLAVALAGAVPSAAHAQAAAGIAQAMMGIAFGVMFPAPQCGPHDAVSPLFEPARPNYAPPPPYQPARPDYLPPPQADQRANLDHHSNFDDDDDFDDDFDQPVHHHPPKHRDNSYSRQPQNRPYADEESDQTTNLRAGDADQPGDQSATGYDDDQPASSPVSHRHRHHQAQATQQTQSGQVAEIPSLPSARQPSPRTDELTPEQ